MTIYESILNYTNGKDWLFAGDIARVVGATMGKKESNVERRCRELAAKGLLERREIQINGKGNKVVQYRKPAPQKVYATPNQPLFVP